MTEQAVVESNAEATSASHGRNVFIEFHVLRSFAPGNMNRDELGTPKTAVFGGVRRLRVSSQCVKRTWRMSEWFRGELAREVLGIELLGVRTKRLPLIVRQEIGASLGEEALTGLEELLQRIGRKGASSKEEDQTTAHLLFLTREEIDAVQEFAKKQKKELEQLAKLVKSSKGGNDANTDTSLGSGESDEAHGEGLDSVQSKPGDTTLDPSDGEPSTKGKRKGSRGRKKGAKADDGKEEETLLKSLQSALKKHLAESAPRNAVDVALFGRFVTSDEFKRVDAAMQVAHAIGTQKVELEYDYFTAVDDLKPKDEDAGAGHLGETEFAQSVLYQYAVCDWKALLENLKGYGEKSKEVAARAMKAIALAATRAVPVGKKNSTAPQNPADYVEIIVRRDAPISLANAFLKPVSVRDGDDRDVMDLSIERLRTLRAAYHRAYSKDDDVLGRFVLSLRELHAPKNGTEEGKGGKGEVRADSLSALAKDVEKLLVGLEVS
jgi:CRISPR system Cascade subunit CasC